MKLSQLFGQTLHEPPADTSTRLSASAEVVSHQLLVQVGFICPRAGMDAVKSAYTTNGTQAREKFEV